MANIKELRLRIKALKNTSKITAAMKMVSAAKLKKAQDNNNRTKPYATRMEEMLDRVLGSVDTPDHPLIKARENRTTRYVLISSDRGLCAGFNNNLFKAYQRRPVDTTDYRALGLGRRARELLLRLSSDKALSANFTNMPTYANASSIAKFLMKDYLEGKCDRVVLVYNRFRSVISQTPVFVPILPFTPEIKVATKLDPKNKGMRDDYFLEPDAEALFAELLPKLVTLQVFRALLENAVGEHSARMAAMDSATKNTKELIGSLTLTMNRARQAAITRELIESVSRAEALKG